MVTGSLDTEQRQDLEDTADGKLIAELKGHAGGVSPAAFSPDGAQVVRLLI